MAVLIEKTLCFIPLDRTYKKYENLYVLGKTWKDRLQNDHNETLNNATWKDIQYSQMFATVSVSFEMQKSNFLPYLGKT